MRFVGDTLLNLLGLLIVVPSNPETTYFQLAEGVLSMIKDKDWGTQPHVYLLKAKLLSSLIYYLHAQA